MSKIWQSETFTGRFFFFYVCVMTKDSNHIETQNVNFVPNMYLNYSFIQKNLIKLSHLVI